MGVVDFNVAAMCAVCRKPVPRLDVWTDPFDRDIHVKAHCHGETEERVLQRLVFHAMVRTLTMFKPLSPSLVREDERPITEDDH